MDFDKYNAAQATQNKNIIAIDFDGVVHRSSKGFYDGTIYDDPVDGSLEAIKKLNEQGYSLVMYTCKANPHRPLVNQKTGTDLIWEWLEGHGVSHYFLDVVWGKPWAAVYIDDKGYRFENWIDTLDFVNNLLGEKDEIN